MPVALTLRPLANMIPSHEKREQPTLTKEIQGSPWEEGSPSWLVPSLTSQLGVKFPPQDFWSKVTVLNHSTRDNRVPRVTCSGNISGPELPNAQCVQNMRFRTMDTG